MLDDSVLYGFMGVGFQRSGFLCLGLQGLKISLAALGFGVSMFEQRVGSVLNLSLFERMSPELLKQSRQLATADCSAQTKYS